ncbi:hypothetical protein N866_06380 [Actinotalea ferrariae CF5-4]|uniref:PAS domain-containing protein n=1 Tax=Actinotalea ferrariae CF5-4 TaxID=948458 RepID=A0A021VN92_9CELL|nr:hypothetical protein N866_06380 [Actinotalea ferrariae CF5-4]
MLRLAQVLADARAQAGDAVRALDQAEHRLEVLTAATHDAILVLDRGGVAISTNLTADLWALSSTHGPGAWSELAWVHPQARDRVTAAFQDALDRPGVPVTTDDVPVRFRTDGSLRRLQGAQPGGLVRLTFTNLLSDAAIEGVVLTVTDVSDRAVNEERLVFAAHHDPETGLGNRAELELHLQMLQEDGAPVALIVLETHALLDPADTRPAGGPLLPLAIRLRDHVVTAPVHHLGGGRFVIASTEHLDRASLEAAAASLLQIPLGPLAPRGRRCSATSRPSAQPPACSGRWAAPPSCAVPSARRWTRRTVVPAASS